MTKTFRALPSLALLAITSTAAKAQGLPPSGFEVGEPFPNIAFPSLDDGRPMSLADFRGKKFVLHIWASW